MADAMDMDIDTKLDKSLDDLVKMSGTRGRGSARGRGRGVPRGRGGRSSFLPMVCALDSGAVVACVFSHNSTHTGGLICFVGDGRIQVASRQV